MKTGLKKREKILVFIAVVVGLISLTSTYVISPMYSLYGEKQAEYDRLTHEQFQLETKFANEAVYRQSNDDARSGFDKITRRYPQIMPNDEIDNLLTGLCLRNDLKPTSLRLSDAAAYTVQGEPDTEEGLVPAFSTVSADMTLQGSYDSLISLIGAVARYDYIRITGVRYTQPRILREIIDIPDIAVSFEVTMMNPVE